MIPRLPHSWFPGSYPYEVLAGTGITPQTPHTEVLAASLRLMKAGAMTPAVRQAWDEVRVPGKRLATEFFLFNAELADVATLVRDALRRLRAALDEHQEDRT